MPRFPAGLVGAALVLGLLQGTLAAQSLSAPDLIESLVPRVTTRTVPLPADDTPAGPDGDKRGVRRAEEEGAVTQPRAGTTAPAGMPAVSITVQFATGSATISPAAGRALIPLGQALSSPQLSAYRFRIEGHTDTVGSDATNRDLSQRRAEAVRDYLVGSFRLPRDRLEAIGLGESQPLVPTPDNTPEARNRRVQVVNLGS